MSIGAATVLTLCVIICAAAVLLPWVGYVGYAGFAILTPQHVWRDSLAGMEMQKFLSGFTIFGFALTGFRSQKLPRGVKWALAFYTMYVVIVLLGSGVQTSPEKTAKFVEITWKIWLMSMVGMMLIDNQRKLTILMASLLIASSWNAWELNRLYQYQGFIRVNGFTFSGLDSNVYSISTLPIACIPLAFLMISKDTKWQLIAGFTMAMHMHQLMILESRGTMLGAVFAGILLVVFMPKNPRNWGMTAMILIVGGTLAGPPVVKEFMSSFEKGEDLDSSAESRYEVWKAGARIMMDYPVTGVGPWCGELYVPKYYEGFKEDRENKALHNLFFEVGTGMGVPGVTVYLLYFFIPWWMHFRLWKKGIQDFPETLQVANLTCLIGIPGYWFASMFSSGAMLESPYIMMGVACVSLAVTYAYRDQREKDRAIEQDALIEEMELNSWEDMPVGGKAREVVAS